MDRNFKWDSDVDPSLLVFLPETMGDMNPPKATGWITISEFIYDEDRSIHGSLHSVMVPRSFEIDFEFGSGWIGNELGDFQIEGWNSIENFSDGLSVNEHGCEIEFLCNGRKPAGSPQWQFDVSQPFIWFWDAYKIGNEWRYLSEGGNEKPLIRITSDNQGWKIETRAAELQCFLAATSKMALFQFEIAKPQREFDGKRFEAETKNSFAKFHYSEYPGIGLSRNMGWKSLEGRFLVSGNFNKTRPRILSWLFDSQEEYGDFIIGADSSGEDVVASSSPDSFKQICSEFESAPGYLTPVFFKREVLDKYIARPSIFRVSATRLECSNLWGIDLSINEYDLVVVYLGDIGERIPREEHKHWICYNVFPEGGIDEGRFRRDFLGQWCDSPDDISGIKSEYTAINSLCRELFGFNLWKAPDSNLKSQIDSLIAPTSRDRAALVSPVLTLTKWLVDSIDHKSIIRFSEGEIKKGTKPLETVEFLFDHAQWPHDLIIFLRSLQGLRSRGGIAHLSNSESEKAFSRLGITGDDAASDFKMITSQLLNAMKTVTSTSSSPQ